MVTSYPLEKPYNKSFKCAPATEVASAGHFTAGSNLCVISFSHKFVPSIKCRLMKRYDSRRCTLKIRNEV